MKRSSVFLLRQVIVFVCAMLLIAGSIPIGEIEKVAAVALTTQATVVTEMEPNDESVMAQEIPFPAPGGKVVLQGKVAGDEPGSFSPVVNQVFGSLGPFQDWFIADPDSLPEQPWRDGPISLKFTVDWEPRTADLDVVVGNTVDPGLFYFDGFDLLCRDQLITDANPELWPGGERFAGPGASIVRYLQPKGITGVDGNRVPNDGFGRKLMIGIHHAEGAPVDYTLTIETGPFGSEEHLVDDEGLTAVAGKGFDHNLIVTRVRPTRYPATLTTLTHPFAQVQGFPDPTGKTIRVVVFAGDRDDVLVDPPSHPTFMVDQIFTIVGTGFVDIPINPPVTINSGVVYVGFQLAQTDQTGVFPIFSTNPVQYLRTSFSSDGGMTWKIPAFTEDLSGKIIAANQYLRPTFKFNEPSAEAANPEDDRGKHRADRIVLRLKPAVEFKTTSRSSHTTDIQNGVDQNER